MMSRRNALAAAAASPFAFSGLGVAQPSGALARTLGADGADAELLARCAVYMALERAIESHPANDMIFPPADLREEENNLSRQSNELCGVIAGIPAVTMAGVLAKARVTRAALGYVTPPDPDDDDALTWSLCGDLLRMGADA